MESGGVSKSMLSLLHTVDKVKYDIDLLVVNPVGVFMNQLPTGINVITDKRASLFFSEFPHNIVLLLRNGYWFAAFCRLLAGIISRFDRGWAGLLMSKFLPDLPDMYNLAVDYNGQQQLYYLIDKVKAEKKVSFFHSDYAKWPYYYSVDKRYYHLADQVFTISEICVNSLKNYFQNAKNKISLFENISSPYLINSLANETIPETFDSNVFVSIGHLSELKGTTLGIEAAKVLKDAGIVFKWIFIGYDTKDRDYKSLVSKLGLNDFILFLGIKPNPYPYLKIADIVVHTSTFEGKSIALDEAKIMCKPIVVTNFSTVNDQFTNRVNATIVEMSPNSIANAILDLIKTPTHALKYVSVLKASIIDNTNEINKLYNLL